MVPGPKFYNAVLCTDYVCRESISWPHRENCKSITKIINRDFVIRLCAPLANRDWLPMFADDSISSTLNFSSLPVEALCQHRKENPGNGNVHRWRPTMFNNFNLPTKAKFVHVNNFFCEPISFPGSYSSPVFLVIQSLVQRRLILSELLYQSTLVLHKNSALN